MESEPPQRDSTTVVFVGLMALFFVALVGAGVYHFTFGQPRDFDRTGGTELMYVLDFEPQDRAIKSAQAEAEAARQSDPTSLASQTLIARVNSLKNIRETASEQTAAIIQKRVDPKGGFGIRVALQGENKDHLRIQIPQTSEDDIQRLRSAIESNCRLTFHICAYDQDIVQATRSAPEDPQGHRVFTDKDGVTYVEMTIKTPKKITPGLFDIVTIVAKQEPDFDGSHITQAKALKSSYTNSWEIELHLDAAGSAEFALLTRNNIKRQLAIVVNGTARSAPIIQTEISGVCTISGNFSREESEKLAAALAGGILPVDVKLESTSTVGPKGK